MVSDNVTYLRSPISASGDGERPAIRAYGGGDGGGTGGGDGMSEPVSREELKDKLATAEAKGDVKFERMIGTLNLITEKISAVGSDVSQIKHDNKNLKWTIIGTAFASVLAILAILLADRANMISAFQTGLTAVSTVVQQPAPKAK